MLEGIETSHQEGWALAVLAAIFAEDGEAAAGAPLAGPGAAGTSSCWAATPGIAYCRELEAIRRPAE